MANPYFNAAYYLANNPDLAAAGIETAEGAWNHYEQHGASEGRAPAPWFDAAYYLEQNADLAEAGVSGLGLFEHFVNYGIGEGRQPSADAAAKVTEESLAVYAAANADLRAIFGIEGSDITEEQYEQLASHFYAYGYTEDRPGAPAEWDVDGGDGGEPEPSIPGETFFLSDGRDNLVGTENDDTFIGLAGQNQNGSIANAFATGDYIDGGAGRDKIQAVVMEDQEVDSGADATINARTVNVEEVHFEALNLNGIPGAQDTVSIDAGAMNSVEEFWSDNSSANLYIQDVRLGSKLNVTKDVTFGLRDTDFATGFVAHFDSQSLIAAPDTASNSQLLVRIADVSTETPLTPLANVNLNLSFDLGDETVTLEDIQSTDGTYAGLVAALQVALAEAGYSDVVVQLSEPYNQVTFAGNTVTLPFTAQEILLTDPNGNDFSNVNFTQSAIEPVPGGFLVAGNADPVDPSSVSNLIESNLVLDNAGRGSLAGIVEIGGMSNSGKGIEKFNVTVDRSSKIEALWTTGPVGTLKEIDIDSQGANGDLWIGGTEANVNEIDANAFAGSKLSLGQGDTDYGGSNDPITNLKFLNAENTTADVTFVGDNFGGLAASILTGSGDDKITLFQDGVSSSLSTPTSVVIDAGNGDNIITLDTIAGAESVTGLHNSAIVTTGSGADVITGGSNQLTVDAGAGNDVIYADNTGLVKTEAVIAVGDWATAAGTSTEAGSTINNIQLLHGRTVTVTLGLPDGAGSVATRNVDGFERNVTVEASNGYLTTERDLYEAAASAINDPNGVLSSLAEATVNSHGNLIVTYKIDGLTTVADAVVDIRVGGDWAGLGTAARTNIVNDLKAEYQNSDISSAQTGYDAAATNAAAVVTIAGVESLVDGGVSIVTGGAGNDVIVLNSNDTVAVIDVVAFEAGQFGNDTIVHFTSGAAGDQLDFTDWLSNETSASGSVESRKSIDTALNADATIVASEVTIVDFSALSFTATGVTYGNMTDSQVLGALNSSYNVGSTTDLVGTTQHSLLFVHNENNDGQYKVYQVTSNNTAGSDFAGVTLVGQLDFGVEQTFVVDNFVL